MSCPQQNNLTTILVACDGSAMAASASVYLLSTPTLSGPKESNIAVASSPISKFSIPLNESKASLFGIETVTNLVKVIKRHPDVNPSKLNIDLVLDASCLGHLLRPNISIKNRVINNSVNNIVNNNLTILKLLPDAAIRYGWGRGEKNPADLTSKLFLTPSKIINSTFYRQGPIDYLKQDPYGHVFLTVTKDGEQYNPPQAELGVVSNDH